MRIDVKPVITANDLLYCIEYFLIWDTTVRQMDRTLEVYPGKRLQMPALRFFKEYSADCIFSLPQQLMFDGVHNLCLTNTLLGSD